MYIYIYVCMYLFYVSNYIHIMSLSCVINTYMYKLYHIYITYIYIYAYIIYNIYIYVEYIYMQNIYIYVEYIYMIFDHQSHGTCKVWCLQHFAATVAHVLKDEIDEIASILSQANPRPWQILQGLEDEWFTSKFSGLFSGKNCSFTIRG